MRRESELTITLFTLGGPIVAEKKQRKSREPLGC